jgi:hypothetical protein
VVSSSAPKGVKYYCADILVIFSFIVMDRYQRVEKPRNETPISQNEIRITTQGRMRNYISYGMSLLEVIQ